MERYSALFYCAAIPKTNLTFIKDSPFMSPQTFKSHCKPFFPVISRANNARPYKIKSKENGKRETHCFIYEGSARYDGDKLPFNSVK